MQLTDHEKIRVTAGFQARYNRQAFINEPDGIVTKFFVTTDDYVKIAPEFSTGNSIGGISDVKVYVGLSGVVGASQLVVTAVDPDEGSVTLGATVPSGASLMISYASSSLPSYELEQVRKEAESRIKQRLSLCYDLPISPIPSILTRLATELAAALLLSRNYGVASEDTAADGYALLDRLLGKGQIAVGQAKEQASVVAVGEIGLICTKDYELIDDDGTIIIRNDADSIKSNRDFVKGGRIKGRIYDITEEPFRFKDFQVDADRNQKGSGT